MAYQLIIVDDEQIIREGLISIVDWDSLGFEIAGEFADGREAIKFIDSASVDVVLTDIKMTFVSGIEVAKYVYEQKNNIIVVLISGYKEFELALEAMKYGVENYILKPTDMDKLISVFTVIREKLDTDREESVRAASEKERYEEVLPILREQFFIDLLMGTIVDKEYVYNRSRLIYPNINPECATCFIGYIQIENYENYVKNIWHYGKNELFRSIKNVILSENQQIQYHIIFKVHESIQVFGIFLKNEHPDELSGVAAEQSLEAIRAELKQLLDLDVTCKISQLFGSILEVISSLNPILPDKGKTSSGEIVSMEDMNRLREKQKLMLSNINLGNMEAVKNLFQNFLKDLKYFDIRTIKNYVVDLVAMISDSLKEYGIDAYDLTNGKFNYSLPASMKDIDEVEEWGNEVLGILADHMSGIGKNQGNDITCRAKKYIQENCSKDISLEEVADFLYLSPFYFSRIFKKQTGENFIDYLVKVKIERAIALLEDNKYKTYEICDMIGYKSTRYFSKIFKQHTGYTPSDYRSIILNKAGVKQE